ncbi:MAG TPA: hypothetical protein DDW16_00025 [Clostridiales bacterium]|nr:hypothetical protein [Clostridiales bacterium]
MKEKKLIEENSLQNVDNSEQNISDEELFNYVDECRISLDVNDKTIDEPLEVLLILIKEAKIAVEDIFISKVTEQFLAYVERLKDKNIEELSSYLVIASKILEIKARALLPIVDEETDSYDYSEDEDAVDLINRINEYEMFKQAGEKLKAQEMLDRFYKEPDESTTEVKVVFNDFNIDKLVQAFSEVMLRYNLGQTKRKDVKEIPSEEYSEDKKIRFVSDYLKEKQSCSFFELFNEDSPLAEIITTFKVMLELIKLQCIGVEQNNVYDDITLTFKREWSEEDGRIEDNG